MDNPFDAVVAPLPDNIKAIADKLDAETPTIQELAQMFHDVQVAIETTSATSGVFKSLLAVRKRVAEAIHVITGGMV